jgi:alkanesulfonate monooxygenase SsuD/methylene tetrahydromethanopterin reductase-like flavin-dependent oxidoreductase (luciferase family)
VTEGRGRLRFGVMCGPEADWPALRDFAQRAEELGFDSYWASDHPTTRPDGWMNLAALAACTRRLRLGTMVSCAYYRGPLVHARLAADLDRLSGGRAVLGLGSGWSPTEFAQLGLPFPGAAERARVLRTALDLVERLWAGEAVTRDDGLVRLAGAGIRPLPAQRVPVLVAGGGEHTTLRLVAEYADASNIGEFAASGGAVTLDDVRRKLEALRAHCAAAGRPYDSVLRSHYAVPVLLAETEAAREAKLAAVPAGVRDAARAPYLPRTPAGAVAYYRGLAGAGLTYFVARIVGNDVETVDLLARRVIPELAGFPVEQP